MPRRSARPASWPSLSILAAGCVAVAGCGSWPLLSELDAVGDLAMPDAVAEVGTDPGPPDALADAASEVGKDPGTPDAHADAASDAAKDPGPDVSTGALATGHFCTEDGWCRGGPLPSSDNFNAVRAFSPTDAWVAGYGGTVLHWDGTGWERQSLGTNVALFSLWGPASDDLWAVGAQGSAFHFDGHAWTAVATGTPEDLSEVWGSGPADVWAVGNRGTALHWDGQAFAAHPVASDVDLLAVNGSGPSDVWAGGTQTVHLPYVDYPRENYRRLFRWDGQAWEDRSPVQVKGYVTGVWVAAPGDLHLIGFVRDYLSSTQPDTGFLQHGDGTTWTEKTLGKEELVGGLFGFAPDDAWAVGDHGRVLHWNGQTWSDAPTPIPANRGLRSVHGSSPHDLWIAGGGGTVAHRDAAGWTLAPGVQEDYTPDYHDFWGPSADDVWAATSRGVYRGDRDGFRKVFEPGLSSIWGFSDQDVWVAGNGRAVHWDGQAATPYAYGDSNWIVDLWGSGPDDLWGVGGEGYWQGAGVVVHWDGSAWTTVKCPANYRLFGVWGTGPADVWVTGGEIVLSEYRGGVVHWDGQAWTTLPGSEGHRWKSVFARSPSDVWVAGDELGHWDGQGWTLVPLEYPYIATQVLGTATDVWVVGYLGTILHRQGDAWVPSLSGTAHGLRALWAGPDGEVWTAGGSGSVFRRRP